MVKHLAPIKMFGERKNAITDRVDKDLSVDVEKIDDESDDSDSTEPSNETPAELTTSTPAAPEVTGAKD